MLKQSNTCIAHVYKLSGVVYKLLTSALITTRAGKVVSYRINVHVSPNSTEMLHKDRRMDTKAKILSY